MEKLLELLKKKEIKEDMFLHVRIFSDESGTINDGNDNELFEFNDIFEAEDYLENGIDDE